LKNDISLSRYCLEYYLLTQKKNGGFNLFINQPFGKIYILLDLQNLLIQQHTDPNTF